MDEIPPKMLEASLIDESANINVEREVLSDEEEIYSGTLGNVFIKVNVMKPWAS